MGARLRVAAVCTIYHPVSHADAIVSKFVRGMSTDEGYFPPEVDVVSLYLDHVLENDMGMELARQHGIAVHPSIRRALHAGGDRLGVDAVLLIGEHGDYPWNERGRHLYPRRHFFEQIAGVFAESGRAVPVFNDKHFAYDFADARWMWDRAAQLGIPLMAGSCLPLAWRSPWLEHELETPVEAAVAVGFGGIEAYGFHTLETLQCMVERRRGGESGVVAVQCLEGPDVWRARDRGEWPGDLAAAACAAMGEAPAGPLEDLAAQPAVFLIEHADGLRTAALSLQEGVHTWSYAARVGGQVLASEAYLQPDGPGASFGYLCRNIQRFFQTGRAPYPPERTLLTTGIIDAAMDSRHEGHRRIETPWLRLPYRSYQTPFERPHGPRPAGASLDRNAPDLLLPWREYSARGPVSHLRILIVLAHPAYQRSRANRELAEAASRLDGVRLHDLYEAYPDFCIDVPREQQLLLGHDLVVFQYPFYWYSSPALLKEWQDLVLEHGWAYGREGTALAGKQLLAAITAAGGRQDYARAGHNCFTVRQLLAPLEQTARRCGMRFLPPFVVHDTRRRRVDDALGTVAATYARALAGLRDGRLAERDLAGCEYLNDHPLIKDASDG